MIEILATILVISILAALLFPTLSTMTKKQRSTVCLANLRALTQGIGVYAADNDMTYPEYKANINSRAAWYAPLIGTGFGNAPYVDHRGAGKKKPPYFCPENPASLKSGNGQWTNYAMNSHLIGKKCNLVNDTKVLLFDAYQPGTPPETWYNNRGGIDPNGVPCPWVGINPVHGEYINVSFTDGHARAVRVRPGSSTKDLDELKATWFWPYTVN